MENKILIEALGKHPALSETNSLYWDDHNHILSVAQGLIVPDNLPGHDKVFRACGCDDHRLKSSSVIEQQLAGRKHRWREMQKLQVDFFKAFAEKVTEYEKDILTLLKLPDINAIRESVSNDTVDESGSFEFTTSMQNGLDRIFDQWKKDLVGNLDVSDGKIITPKSIVLAGGFTKADAEMSIVEWFILNAFTIGFNRAKKMALAVAPEHMLEYLQTIIMALDNDYFRAMLQTAVQRISAPLTIAKRKELAVLLKQMAKDGLYPMQVGRFIHKAIGEGHLWHWNRLARSETVIASNRAFDYWGQESGVKYEQWSTASNACEVCQVFSNEVWNFGEGPSPVYDTHPHCLCIRVPYYQYTGTVQNKWERTDPETGQPLGSPYDVPYSIEELASNLGLLR